MKPYLGDPNLYSTNYVYSSDSTVGFSQIGDKGFVLEKMGVGGGTGQWPTWTSIIPPIGEPVARTVIDSVIIYTPYSPDPNLMERVVEQSKNKEIPIMIIPEKKKRRFDL